MKKKELLKIIKEEVSESIYQSKPELYFNSMVNFLTGKVYPRLNDTDINELNFKLKRWLDKQ